MSAFGREMCIANEGRQRPPSCLPFPNDKGILSTE